MLTQEPNLAVGRIAADGALSITLSGAWTLRSGFPSAGPIARETATRRPRSVVFDCPRPRRLGQRPGHVPPTPRRALRQPPGRDAPPPLGTYESRIWAPPWSGAMPVTRSRYWARSWPSSAVSSRLPSAPPPSSAPD